jgi:hypothetical protein
LFKRQPFRADVVFVLRGSALHKINPDDLGTVKKITLEETAAPRPPETPVEPPK